MNEGPSESLVMYSFQHFQFAGIHAGIQSGHSWVSMAVKYRYHIPTSKGVHDRYGMFWDWAVYYKTVNVRNGGNQSDLLAIAELFREEDNPYPYQQWREDKGCNECMTAVSIVVPEKVYAWEPKYYISTSPKGLNRIELNKLHFADRKERLKYAENPLTPFEQKLYDLIKRTKHAQ